MVRTCGLLVERGRRRLSPEGEAAADPEAPALSDQSSRRCSSDHAPAPSGLDETKNCCQPPLRAMSKVRSRITPSAAGGTSAKGSAIRQAVRLGAAGVAKAIWAVREVTPPEETTVSVQSPVGKAFVRVRLQALVAHDQTCMPLLATESV